MRRSYGRPSRASVFQIQTDLSSTQLSMKYTMKFLGVIACTTLAAKSPVQAGTHIWSGAVNSSWSQAGNWSSGGAPQVGEQSITLVFPPGAIRTGATNSIVN